MKPSRFTRFFAVAFTLLIAIPVSAQNSDAIFELISKGDLNRAQKAVNSAQKDNQESPDLMFANALIADKKGESKKAIGLYLEIIDAHPAMIASYNNLAIHYAKEGDYKSAVATLEKALSVDQAVATTYGNLQSIFARMASLAYRKALNSDAPTTPLQLAAIESTQEPGVNISQPTLVASAESFIDQTLSASANDTPSTSAIEPDPQADDNNIIVATAAQTDSTPEAPEETTSEPKQTVVEIIAVETPKVAAVVVEPTNTQTEVIVPVKPSEEAKKIAEQNAAEKQALINHVKSWANAWSDRDVDRYLSHYSNSFKPRDNLSLEEWKKQRYGRLRWREFIIVKPSRYSIDLDNELATVNFSQYYKSERFEDTIRKTLKLRKENGKWRITQEFI